MNVWKFNGRPPVRFRLNRQSDGKRLGIPTSTDARMADRFALVVWMATAVVSYRNWARRGGKGWRP